MTRYRSSLSVPQHIDNPFPLVATVRARRTVTGLDYRMGPNGGETSLWTRSPRGGQSNPRGLETPQGPMQGCPSAR